MRFRRIPGLFLFSLIKNNVVTPHENHPRTNNSFKIFQNYFSNKILFCLEMFKINHNSEKCKSNLSVHCHRTSELGPRVIKKFSCSTQLSMKFYKLISIKISRNSAFSGSDKHRMQFFLLKNVEKPGNVSIYLKAITRIERSTYI